MTDVDHTACPLAPRQRKAAIAPVFRDGETNHEPIARGW